MPLSWTPSATLRSLISLYAGLVQFLSNLIQRSGVRVVLYGTLGTSTVILILFMVYPILRGVVSRKLRGESPQKPNVEREVQGQGDDLGENSLRSAPRRTRRPPSLVLSPAHSTQNRPSGGSNIHTARPIIRTYTSDHYTPLSPTPLDAVLGSTCLSQSPTVERDAHARGEVSSTMSRLPTETLVMILQHVSLQHRIRPAHSLTTLLSLRRVCNRWRQIIEGTLELWPSLCPPLRGTGCKSCVDWYTNVIEELSRGDVLFDLVVLELPGEEQGVHRGLLKHLLEFAIRARAMKVIIPPSFLRKTAAGLSSFLMGAPAGRKPSDGPEMKYLRRVEWIMESHLFRDQLPQALEFPWSSLRQLPWTQLTHITLGLSMMLSDCEYILDHAQEIEDLTLGQVSGDPLPALSVQVERKTISHLHSLKINAAISISPLLQRYDLPRLRRLDLELGGADSATDLNHMAVPWGELIHLSLDCSLTVNVMESVISQLDHVEELVLKGQLDDDSPWTLSRVLGSLRSFKLTPKSDAAALGLISHFIDHIFPLSLEVMNAPLEKITFKKIVDRSFSSLKTVNIKTHPISPDDFLSFLVCSPDLFEGSFRVQDHGSLPSTPSLSTTFQPITPPAYAEITCNIVKLDLHLDYQHISAEPLLGALVFPNLSSAKFSASKMSVDRDVLYRLLFRSGCALRKLSLDCPTVTDTEIWELLKLLTSTLESFEIIGDSLKHQFGETLWTKLIHGSTGGSHMSSCLCPRLERLVVSPVWDAHFFYPMLDSRSSFPNECGCGLRKLRKVKAVLKDDARRCDEFASRLKAKNIIVKFSPIPESYDLPL